MKYTDKSVMCSTPSCWSWITNEYGICASCWSKMSHERRSALTGDEVRIVPQTIYKPVSYSRVALVGILSGILGSVLVLSALSILR